MRLLSKKLVLSILTVVALVGALGTTTYAWFTLSNTVSVQKFQVKVYTGEGIEISADGNTYYRTLPNTDPALVAAIAAVKELDAVTSADGKNFSQRTNHTTIAGASADKVLKFDLYFRSNDLNIISLNTANEVTAPVFTSDGQTWKNDIAHTGPDGAALALNQNLTGATAHKAAYAARLSVQGLDDQAIPGETMFIYEDLKSPIGNGAAVTANGAMSYYNAKDATALLTPAIAATDLAGSNAKSGVLAAGVDDIITYLPEDLAAGAAFKYLSKVTVRVWLEGWNPFCYNSIFKDNLTVDLRFQGSK